MRCALRRKGIFGEGAVPVKSYTGAGFARGQAEQQHVSGVHVDDSDVVTTTEESDW